MSWHFDGDENGIALRRTPDMPKWRDLPKAGLPWQLPPPMVEGQEIDYRFYDDRTADMEVRATAVRIDGSLRWAITRRAQAPRAMVGTCYDGVAVPLEQITQQIASQVNRMREQWLEQRLRKVGFLSGFSLTDTRPENFKALLDRAGVKVLRKVFPDREELWINGEFDSVFWPAGRPEEKEKYRFTSCYQSPIV